MLSDELLEEFFCCDLNACKGACCVEGEAGAPLKTEELEPMMEKLPAVKKLLSEESIKIIEKEGPAILDSDGEWVTPTIGDKECVFAFYDDQGILKCSFEESWDGTEKDFRKPISCHLYPAREVELFGSTALNYHQWEICSAACELGKREKIPLFKFLKVALERRFGKEWYLELEQIAVQIKKGPKTL